MFRGLSTEYRDLIKEAINQGWIVTRVKNNHFCFLSPGGNKIFGPSSANDFKTHHAIRSKLRKFGFKD